MILVAIPSRSPFQAVAKAQWHFAWALRIIGHNVRCIVPTSRWSHIVSKYVPAKLQEFLINMRGPRQARLFDHSFVLAPDWHSLYYKKGKGISIFHGCYDLLLRYSPPTSLFGLIKTHFLWFLQKSAASRAPFFIGVSKQVVASFNMPNGFVVYNAINLQQVKFITLEDNKIAKSEQGRPHLDTILMAGRLSPEKRLDSVLDLPCKKNRAYIVAIPDSNDASFFARKCLQRSDISIISCPDGIPEHIWNITDVVYMPSRFEGCSLLWIESAARGIPVVASQAGHLLELIEMHPLLKKITFDVNILQDAPEIIDYALDDNKNLKFFMRELAEMYHDINSIAKQFDHLLSGYIK